MMLDRPDLVEAEFVGQHDLFKAVVVDSLFGFAVPGPRYGDFIKGTELHRFTSRLVRSNADVFAQGKSDVDREMD